MLLRQIEYFCAVCRAGSFTRAAEECFVSQSAVSQQVKALEAELGVALIERRGRSFELTKAGEHFRRRAQDILADLEDLRFETEAVANGCATELRFGYLNRYDGWEVQGAVAAFAARHPRIAVTATPGSHDELYHAMLAGDIDLSFNDRRRALSDDFMNVHLFTGYDFAEVSEASPLAEAESLRVADLRGTACILIASPGLEDAERRFYRDMLNFDCEFRFARTREEGRMLVAGNHGFMPTESRNPGGPDGHVIRRIPLVGPDGGQLHRDYYAFWPKPRTTPLVMEFSTILEGLFEKDR